MNFNLKNFIRFRENLGQYFQEAKESVLLMNIREHLYNPLFVEEANLYEKVQKYVPE